jgi:hypothetical protein
MVLAYLVACPLLAGCGPAEAKAPTNVPLPLRVPGNPAAPKLHAVGRGVQIYMCAASTGSYAWTLKAPQATLFDARSTAIGKHYAGPTWELDDGSKIVGSVLQKVAAPNAAADIPWLLLQVSASSGAGGLAGVRYVQRLDTAGGTAPTSGCDAG